MQTLLSYHWEAALPLLFVIGASLYGLLVSLNALRNPWDKE